VDQTWRTNSKEGQDSFIGGKSNGIRFLGCERNIVDRLSSKRQDMNDEYYANLLKRLKTAIAEKHPGINKRKVLFHQVNSCAVAAKKNEELGF
jgi:hypothetical protein